MRENLDADLISEIGRLHMDDRNTMSQISKLLLKLLDIETRFTKNLGEKSKIEHDCVHKTLWKFEKFTHNFLAKISLKQHFLVTISLKQHFLQKFLLKS